MHDNLWCEVEEDVLEEANGESEAGPVCAVLKDIQAVTIEFNVAVKVHVVEALHWDSGLAMVLQPIGLVLKGEVVLDWAARQPDFLVAARAEA